MPAAVDGLKFCPKCRLTKPVAEFGVDRYRKDGRTTYCRPCQCAFSTSYSAGRKLLAPEPSADGLSRCCICREVKPLSAFNRSRRRKSGVEAYCQPCSQTRAARRRENLRLRGAMRAELRKHNMQHTHRLSLEEYTTILKGQGGVCAICGKSESVMRKNTPRHLVVDHDHETGKRRDLLCSVCNLGIGHFQDSPALLEKAAAYLRRHGKN